MRVVPLPSPAVLKRRWGRATAVRVCGCVRAARALHGRSLFGSRWYSVPYRSCTERVQSTSPAAVLRRNASVIATAGGKTRSGLALDAWSPGMFKKPGTRTLAFAGKLAPIVHLTCRSMSSLVPRREYAGLDRSRTRKHHDRCAHAEGGRDCLIPLP